MESILTAAGRKSALIGTIEYHVAGQDFARAAHHSRGARTESHLERSAGTGCDRRRDGSFIARAGAAARVRRAVRRGRLHQPDARSSRLSQNHGRILRRQASSVRGLRHGCSARRGHESRRRIRREAGRIQPQAQCGRSDIRVGARRLARGESGHQRRAARASIWLRPREDRSLSRR